MSQTYRQCLLLKPLVAGEARMIGWVPEPLAYVGAELASEPSASRMGPWCWTVQIVFGKSMDIAAAPWLPKLDWRERVSSQD